MLKINCKDKWVKARKAAIDHYDETFNKCMMQLLNYYAWEGVAEVDLFSDFSEHSFYFEVRRADGSCMMNGGVIFHGFPKEGYQQNGSVQLSPAYGWQIHT